MWLENAESEKLALTEAQVNKLLHDAHNASDVNSHQIDVFFDVFCIIASICLIVAFVSVIACEILDIHTSELPRVLWNYFTRKLPKRRKAKNAIRKHKKGNMSGILHISEIDPEEVLCRDISAQDVLNANLSILELKLMENNLLPTWDKKVKWLAKNWSSMRLGEYIFNWQNNGDLSYTPPDELLLALLEDKKSVEMLCNLGCNFRTISKMSNAKHRLAMNVMTLVDDVKSNKTEGEQ